MGKRFQLFGQAAGKLANVRFLSAAYSQWQVAAEPVSEAAEKIGTPIAAVFIDGDINRTNL